jgi:hypothetical protein
MITNDARHTHEIKSKIAMGKAADFFHNKIGHNLLATYLYLLKEIYKKQHPGGGERVAVRPSYI